MVDGKQLKDASIPDGKMVESYTKADGSRAFTNPVAGVDPTLSTHLATKAYVDALLSGGNLKQAVRLATTANISLTGVQTIDGVVGVAGDRILVKNQSTASQNGIYVMAAGAWSRSTDADNSVITSEVLAGMLVPVTEGSSYADSMWELTTDGTITLGSTSLTFTYYAGIKASTLAVGNKDMTASVTASDFDAANVTAILAAPSRGGSVSVFVNGIRVQLGDGVKTKHCYFSSDSGTTAKAIASIAAGDLLYWVGSVAGYQLAVTDKIDFDYVVQQ